MRSSLLMAACVLSATTLTSCGGGTATPANTIDSTTTGKTVNASVNTTGDWVALFDGKSLDGWHSFNRKGEKVPNWDIEDSALVCLGAAKDAHGGDIVSDGMYDNFEMTWDWKVNKGSNSGVMYHVVEDPKYQAPYETGPEYQMIDDVTFPQKLEGWQQTGADYAMTVANDRKKLKPVGEWNSSKIIFNNGHVEHWLNGEKIVAFEAWTDEWNKHRLAGKWKDYPDYGKAHTGGIALQDHGNKVFFKHILLRRL